MAWNQKTAPAGIPWESEIHPTQESKYAYCKFFLSPYFPANPILNLMPGFVADLLLRPSLPLCSYLQGITKIFLTNLHCHYSSLFPSPQLQQAFPGDQLSNTATETSRLASRKATDPHTFYPLFQIYSSILHLQLNQPFCSLLSLCLHSQSPEHILVVH